MDFPFISTKAIKAISQHALCDYWRSAANGRPLPSIDDFNPDGRIHDPKQLMVWGVEEGSGKRRFRALYQGDHLLDAFGTCWLGKTMDEVVPDFARYFILASANECATSKCAIYSVLRAHDANGHAIDCERLILPLGRTSVEQVVSSVQLVSPLGEFRRSSVVETFKAGVELTLAGKIRSTASAEELRIKPSAGARPQRSSSP